MRVAVRVIVVRMAVVVRVPVLVRVAMVMRVIVASVVMACASSALVHLVHLFVVFLHALSSALNHQLSRSQAASHRLSRSQARARSQSRRRQLPGPSRDVEDIGIVGIGAQEDAHRRYECCGLCGARSATACRGGTATRARGWQGAENAIAGGNDRGRRRRELPQVRRRHIGDEWVLLDL